MTLMPTPPTALYALYDERRRSEIDRVNASTESDQLQTRTKTHYMGSVVYTPNAATADGHRCCPQLPPRPLDGEFLRFRIFLQARSAPAGEPHRGHGKGVRRLIGQCSAAATRTDTLVAREDLPNVLANGESLVSRNHGS